MFKKTTLILLLVCSLKHKAQVDSVYTGELNSSGSKKETKRNSNGLNKLSDNLVYGGFVLPGFAATSYGSIFYVSANPNIGYKVNSDLLVGMGFSYNYVSFRPKGGGQQTQSIYGPNVFARYMVMENVFAQIQYDKLNQPNYVRGSERIWVDYFHVGGGYYQRIGDNSALVCSILYNVIPTRNSFYSNPQIQFGFIAGF